MSAVLSTPKTTSGGEIITHLINSSDGAGLHFDGLTGNVEIAAGASPLDPPNLGTKFSFEFIIQANALPAASGYADYIADFGDNGGRFLFCNYDGNLSVYSVTTISSLGVNPLSDLKVHHLVLTVDGTAAVLWDNGNQVGDATIAATNIDLCTSARLGTNYGATGNFWPGNIFRARLWNKTLSQANITELYENAAIKDSDKWGEQNLVDPAASVFTSGTYNWSVYGSNTVANVANELVITYVDNASGAYNYLRNTKDLTKDLIVGKKYRLTIDAKYTGGSAGPIVMLQGNAGVGANGTIATLTTSLVTYTHEFIASFTTAAYINFSGLGASNVVTIDNWYLDEIGCVADYDLAMANPAISTVVQNRNSTISADGTASSGCTQITAIEQVNVNKLMVGGTVPEIGIGGVPTVPLDIHSGAIALKIGADSDAISRTNATLKYGRIGSQHYTNAEEPVALVVVKADSSSSEVRIGGGTGLFNAATALQFYTAANTTTPTGSVRLTIDSAGNSTFSGGADAVTKVLGTTTGARLDLQTDSHHSFMQVVESDGRFRIYNQTAGAERFSISSAGLATFSAGIAVNGAAGQFANGLQFTQTGTTATGAAAVSTVLDHYEEGTWTPVIGGGTCTNVVGKYTRVGNKVTVTVSVLNGVLTSATTNQITGLPFTVGSTRSSTSSVAYYNIFEVANPFGLLTAATTDIYMSSNVAGGNWTAAGFTNTSSVYLHFSATYFV